MFRINRKLHIPDAEFDWQFVRSSGPGGQNVNKVNSKAILQWDLTNNETIPDEVKERFAKLVRRKLSNEGVLTISSQRYRAQERNREDCLEKLRNWMLKAAVRPPVRKKTKPSRGAKEARLRAKKQRSAVKSNRRPPSFEN